MVVRGTPLAPGAHGNATLTKTASGWRIELSATGLPHLQNGRYYQAWLKNAAGILVPVGTFNDARKVTLWSGVPVTQFRTLTVTVQQANGNPVVIWTQGADRDSNARALTFTATACRLHPRARPAPLRRGGDGNREKGPSPPLLRTDRTILTV